MVPPQGAREPEVRNTTKPPSRGPHLGDGRSPSRPLPFCGENHFPPREGGNSGLAGAPDVWSRGSA